MNEKNWIHPFCLRKSDLLWIGIPILLWLGLIWVRPYVFQTACTQAVHTCLKEFLFPVDRLAFGIEEIQADQFSNYTQNFAGIYGVLAPLIWNWRLWSVAAVSRAVMRGSMITELTLLVQTGVWNGLFTEMAHFLTQRPRPFVYSHLVKAGDNPAHYTSFYSGHTSFTAAIGFCVCLILMRRRAPFILIGLAILMFEMLTFLTGYFRIMAGRHFLTDVVCGMVAGPLVATGVVCWHQIQKKKI